MPDPIFCPFCGTKHALVPECSGRWQQIVCGACGARGPEVYRWLPYRTAVESWNVRQGPADTNTTHRPDGVKGTPADSPPLAPLPYAASLAFPARTDGVTGGRQQTFCGQTPMDPKGPSCSS